MARRQEEREIKGCTYKVTALDARSGSRLLQKLGSVLAGFVTNKASIELQFGAAMRGIEDISEIVDVLTTQAWADNKHLEKTWPEHFAGEYGALTEFVVFALEVNYGNFTDDLETLMGRYKLGKPEPETEA